KIIVFAGDMYHEKKRISKDVANVVASLFRSYENFPITFVMIPGNHDYVDKNGSSHSLIPLRGLRNVVISDWTRTDMSMGQDNLVYIDVDSNEEDPRVLIFNAVPFHEDKAELIRAMK